MRVRVRGGSQQTREQLRQAAHWYGREIVGGKMHDNLYVRIDLVPNLQQKENCLASVVWLKTNHRPRHFVIEMDPSLSKRMRLRCLAHEFVHIRQYSRDYMKDLYDCTKFRWYKKIFSEHDIDTQYKTLPWEIEARKLEKHFYHAYVRSSRESSTKQKASPSV